MSELHQWYRNTQWKTGCHCGKWDDLLVWDTSSRFLLNTCSPHQPHPPQSQQGQSGSEGGVVRNKKKAFSKIENLIVLIGNLVKISTFTAQSRREHLVLASWSQLEIRWTPDIAGWGACLFSSLPASCLSSASNCHAERDWAFQVTWC